MKVQLEDGQIFSSNNCVDYLNIAVDNIKNSLRVDKISLKNYGEGHMPRSSIVQVIIIYH